MRRCKALSERGFSVAAFRGKFHLNNVAVEAPITPDHMGFPYSAEEQISREKPSGDPETASEQAISDNSKQTSRMKQLISDAEDDDDSSGRIENKQQLDPRKVPLLAVIGWDGDGGEAASLACTHLTLWNISEGLAFLRLKTPALQVMSLEW